MTTNQPLDNSQPAQTSKAGVLLVNLGTPDAPERQAIRQYLKQFLGARRVVQAPALLCWLILILGILPFRPKGLFSKYQQIRLTGGSPIKVITEQQNDVLAQRLQAHFGDH